MNTSNRAQRIARDIYTANLTNADGSASTVTTTVETTTTIVTTTSGAAGGAGEEQQLREPTATNVTTTNVAGRDLRVVNENVERGARRNSTAERERRELEIGEDDGVRRRRQEHETRVETYRRDLEVLREQRVMMEGFRQKIERAVLELKGNYEDMVQRGGAQQVEMDSEDLQRIRQELDRAAANLVFEYDDTLETGKQLAKEAQHQKIVEVPSVRNREAERMENVSEIFTRESFQRNPPPHNNNRVQNLIEALRQRIREMDENAAQEEEVGGIQLTTAATELSGESSPTYISMSDADKERVL
ncbi:hypothetical protein B7494_g4615 [Chlorociboria aeruginascens]|nr:hypothetical protein B7494_g4615 [Chlorociboria aeruginascens]